VDGADGLVEAVERHASQLKLYRRVAGVLTGLPAEAVSCEIVFLHAGRSVRIPW